MASFSDYGRLRTVVLGTVDDYQPAIWYWKNNLKSTNQYFSEAIALAKTSIPKNIIEEVQEDLEDYSKILTELGVRVIRPPRFTDEPILETKKLLAFGQDFYNMRDLHIVLGNTILSSAPAQPNRILEVNNLKDFISLVSRDYNLEFIQSPIPVLENDPERSYVRDELGDLVVHEEVLSLSLGTVATQIWHRLTEEEILFDAANIIRFENQAVYLISSTGNRLAFNWLQENFENFKFHSTDVYRSSHLDSTILPLDSETFLVNSVRVNPSNLPKVLNGKKILYFHDVENIPEAEIKFHENFRLPAANQIESLGFYTNLKEMSSPWAGLNVLSLDEKTILVESNQKNLIRFLESFGYQIIPVRLRHPYTMLGGLHCTTLDLDRD
jgi:N-dimethylarginine dimethylaminohydrolase